MDLLGDLSLGPLSIPVRYLLAAGIIGAAILLARIPLRRYRGLRARVTDRLINAALILAAAWKLTPALRDPAAAVRDPLPTLMAAPGFPGLAVGAAAAAIYLALSLLRRRGLRRAAAVPLLIVAAAAAIGTGGALLASSAAAGIVPPPGPPAPALSLPTLDGPGFSLDGLRGRVVVVNFWATWCPPCRAELPALREFAQRQGADGAAIVAVNATSTESSEQAVRDFARQNGLGYVVALDRTGEVTRAWDVRAWPTTVIVDRAGRVIARRTGPVDTGWLRREAGAAGRR